MTDKFSFSFEQFPWQHEGPLYNFVLERLGRNGHISELERLQDATADITVEAFVTLYRLCNQEGLLDNDTIISDTKRDELSDGLYKTAAWLCDGP